MDIEERWDVALVEQANVAQVDRLLEEHRRRDHAAVDEIPERPHVVPLLHARQAERRRRGRARRQEREREQRALEQPERVALRAVRPAVHRAEVRVGEELVDILLGVLARPSARALYKERINLPCAKPRCGRVHLTGR